MLIGRWLLTIGKAQKHVLAMCTAMFPGASAQEDLLVVVGVSMVPSGRHAVLAHESSGEVPGPVATHPQSPHEKD